jgi:hypothetical protein
VVERSDRLGCNVHWARREECSAHPIVSGLVRGPSRVHGLHLRGNTLTLRLAKIPHACVPALVQDKHVFGHLSFVLN